MVKCVYEKLIPNGQSLRRIVMTQVILFIILVILCFEYELSIKFLSSLLLFGRRNFYPWSVRIILCSAMILFDALLLLYTFRIYRLYKFGFESLSPVFPVDLALTLIICLICSGYIAGTIHASLTRNISMRSYVWLGRAFIQFSNFFYVPLEITGAILLYKFYHAVCSNKAGEKSE
ncbi:MAG: hypothetical protein IJP48_11875 [Synergistaceae bacterium]|nr:hypothetical protein [Synergistaceae bacterium]